MLTDKEIRDLYDKAYLGGADGRVETFARAILSAHTAKLLAGVEMPEPDGKVAYEDRPYEPAWISSQDAYTEDQLLQYGDARDQAGYLRGLEEAKGVCHDLGLSQEISQAADVCWDCAAAIDKLKGGA